MSNLDNSLRRQVFSLPDLIKQQYEDLEPKTRKIFSTPEIFSFQRIILTGCGDSYAAAMATKHAFEMLTKIPTEVVPAIDLSRFHDTNQFGFSPNNPLVIAVSNSGSVARVAEAVGRAKKYGAFTLGITSNCDSLLGKSASRVLQLQIPDFESAPGIRTYMVSVVTLLLLAIRIGEVRGRYTMDTAMEYRGDITLIADKLAEMLPDMDKRVEDIAGRWRELEAFDFIGSGFDYAAAWYGHAKIFEATGKYAMHINTEEWLHLNFFMRNFEKIGTVVVYNTLNPALSRTREMIKFAEELGRPLMVITDEDVTEENDLTTYVKIPKTKYPLTIPVTEFAPLALLAGYIRELIGEEDGRGCKGPWAFAKGGSGVKNSEIIIK